MELHSTVHLTTEETVLSWHHMSKSSSQLWLIKHSRTRQPGMLSVGWTRTRPLQTRNILRWGLMRVTEMLNTQVLKSLERTTPSRTLEALQTMMGAHLSSSQFICLQLRLRIIDLRWEIAGLWLISLGSSTVLRSEASYSPLRIPSSMDRWQTICRRKIQVFKQRNPTISCQGHAKTRNWKEQ